jgi:ligand-binding sensor domain-containing protein
LNAWRTFDPFDGAIGNWFWTATQTPDNAIWFGTDQGVLRYDGIWRAYGEAEGLPFGSVRMLLLDRNGRLWATTRQGVAYLDGEGWVLEGEAQGLPAQAFLSLAELPDGTLWAGSTNGLFARHAAEGVWQPVAGVPVASIDILTVTADGIIWLASGNRLFRYQDDRWQEIALIVNGNPLPSRITALASDGNGSLWLATSGHGVAHLFSQAVRWYNRRDGLPEDNVLSLWVTREGDVWVGTNGGGVGYWHRGEWSQLDFTDGLAANFVTTIFQDRDGMLWFGTVAGISRYDTHTWTTWEDDEYAPLTRVLTLLMDDRGQVWVGTYGQGLLRFDGTRWSEVTVLDKRSGLPILYFESSFRAADGSLWFGSNGYGVIRYQDGLIEQWTTADGLAHDQVIAITQTPDGAMWFGLLGHGLSRWDGRTWQSLTTDDGLIANDVQALQVDAGGRLWVGTMTGAAMYDAAWHRYRVEDGLAAADVNDIALARDGSLWFATWGGGVSRLHDGQWTTYTTADGLLAPGVDAVWADPDSDRVWFGTVSGLSVFDGQTWQSYGVAQGIGIGRVYEVIGGPADSIYLGTETGVVRFQPDRTPPRVRIAAVNGLMPATTTVSISPDDFLRIGWEGSDLVTAANALFYQYRLHGHDHAWHETRTPMATYSPLPEGAYRFEVRARDTGLNYSESVFLDLVVQRPPSTIWVPWLGPVRARMPPWLSA